MHTKVYTITLYAQKFNIIIILQGVSSVEKVNDENEFVVEEQTVKS